MFKRLSCLAATLMVAVVMMAANTITTVEQVTTAVTVSEDVDYVITSTTPFTASGSVDITNTDHAVVIIANIRPSVVISDWLKYVKVNGAAAQNNKNCQVKMYAQGAIIMPYASDIKPLTVYSEQNYGGTAVNDFGLEHSGGFMNTLTDAKLNNKIRSFKLKRGYMVTFSTRKEGRGYSRCFIADSEDLEFPSLPKILDETISSYRIFKWQDSQKKGLASDGDAGRNAMLTSTWCYDWGQGNASTQPDAEWVPHQIYVAWPSASTCGSVTQSCHMKTNNEPGNSADDTPQSVEVILNQWETLMRTGMRLCSESSHDGSLGHLDEFIDSIDARGWRCDILDLHCYWPKDNFYNWKYWYDRWGGRPIWISEWVVGASWNNNGIFATDRTASDANLALNRQYLEAVIPSMNNSPYVERYAYWNSEAACSKLIIDGKLTPAGEYYNATNTGPAYNRAYEKVPVAPKMKNPTGLEAAYDKDAQKVTLTWHEYNGEYNQQLIIQRKRLGSNMWVAVDTVDQKEDAADYTHVIDGIDGDKYRINVINMSGYSMLSNEATAVNENLQFGDAVTVVVNSEVTQKYLGGNIFVNGDFELGLNGWVNGAGEPLAAPYFQAVPVGSIDGSAFLQCYGDNSSKTSEQSIYQVLTLEPNTSYYVGAAVCNADASSQRILTGSTSIGTSKKLEFPETSTWMNTASSFTTKTDVNFFIQFLSTGAKFMVDNMMLCRLYDTKEEAIADAKVCLQKKAEAIKAYNTWLPGINTLLDNAVNSGDADLTTVQTAIDNAMYAIANKDVCDSLAVNVELATRYGLVDTDVVPQLYADIKNVSQTTLADYVADVKALKEALDDVFKGKPIEDAIKNPMFTSTSGWTTKAGTYTAGDQRTATQAGMTCWNAWWSISAKDNPTATMAVKQELTDLEQGLYSLSCLASTQHYCETDQHSYIEVNGVRYNSQPLKYGLLDLTYISNDQIWNELNTPYVYITAEDVVTIGFEGSKVGAVDKQWMRYGDAAAVGDNREGWWCATDFELNYIPVHVTEVDASGWTTICLKYDSELPSGCTAYQLAGLAPDSSYIALAEYTGTIEAGYPYIIKAEPNSNLLFPLSGSAVTSPKTNVNGLRGVLTSSGRYTVGALVLVDGKWNIVTERYDITPYSAYIRKVDSLTLLTEEWTGEKISVVGLSTGIDGVEVDANANNEGKAYNLSGMPVGDDAKGIIIINNRKVYRK